MVEKKTVEVLVSGGQATAGPPLGPALGPLGVNVLAIVNKINELTKDFSGMKVPVKVTVDPETKEFEITVGTPTTSALIVSELKIKKGSGKPSTEKVGDLSMEQVVRIAKLKRPQLLAKTLKAAAKEVLGSCVSMGVTVDGKDPREVQKEIDEGKYDEFFKDEN
ncbi:MAG TPA: 50S ribosomal protein L11 [Candidatus Bathyarchaeota archaeon]|nr:MAG: 50S ribosomal protein L11 [Candidatus Bathyarchaeota archaeon]HDI07263.1 50S ribosomal protein L11 [Candidatus Bathyarchaeota archaeon]